MLLERSDMTRILKPAALAICLLLTLPTAFAQVGGGAQIDREMLALRQEVASLRAEMVQMRALLNAAPASPSTVETIGSARTSRVFVQAGGSEFILERSKTSLESDQISLKADKIILDAKSIELRGNVTSKAPGGTTIKGTQIGKN